VTYLSALLSSSLARMLNVRLLELTNKSSTAFGTITSQTAIV